jgi:hypothetical protein
MKTGFKNINLRQRNPASRVSSRPLPRAKVAAPPPASPGRCGCNCNCGKTAPRKDK